MASQDKGRPLPKFGEWDVNNPASAEGFTVIFNKARNEKKTATGTAFNMVSPQSNEPIYNNESYPHSPPRKKKWFLLWLKPQWFQDPNKVVTFSLFTCYSVYLYIETQDGKKTKYLVIIVCGVLYVDKCWKDSDGDLL